MSGQKHKNNETREQGASTRALFATGPSLKALRTRRDKRRGRRRVSADRLGARDVAAHDRRRLAVRQQRQVARERGLDAQRVGGAQPVLGGGARELLLCVFCFVNWGGMIVEGGCV